MKKLILHPLSWLCLPFLVLFLFNFIRGLDDEIIALHPNPNDDISDEVMRAIPAGTSVSEAKRIMGKNGFSCSTKQQGMDCQLIVAGGWGFKGRVSVAKFATRNERVINVKALVGPGPA